MKEVVPKSACIGCPWHSDEHWSILRASYEDEFKDACGFDDAIRNKNGMRDQQYIHRSTIPLSKIGEFKHENQGRMFIDQFGNECHGVCGL
jgi:hypothetical protein